MRPGRLPAFLVLLLLLGIGLNAGSASAQTFCDFAPRISPSAARGAVGVQVVVVVTVVDPNGDAILSLTANTSALPPGNDASFTASADNSSGTFTWTPQVGQTGTHQVSFIASNALSTTSTISIPVIDTAGAPFVQCPSILTTTENRLVTFTVAAGDPDGEPITSLTASPLPGGATFTTNASNTAGTFTWTPSFAQAGSYSINFTATSSMSATYTTVITVTNSDRPPVVIVPPNPAGAEGVPMTVCVEAVDPDGDAIVSMSAAPLPAGATFTPGPSGLIGTGTLAWTPAPGQAGSYSVTFSASNALTGQATVTITIGPAGDTPPVVNAPAAQSATVDNTLLFTVSASDANGDPITSLTAAPLPAGAAFFTSTDNTQGSFQWTPTAGQEGTHFVAFTATANELTFTATTAITVGSVRTARIFTTGGNKTLRLNSGKSTWCVDIEASAINFWPIEDILVDTIRLQSPGTGSVSEISPVPGKSAVIGDADRNQLPDLEVCFLKTDLRQLFSNLTGRQTVTVTVRGNLVTGGVFSGTLDLDVAAGGGNAAASLTPNPPGPDATLRFATTRSGAIRVRVFDIRGRLVRTMAAGADQPAGAHALRFDGLAESGRPLPAGVYLFRIETVDGVRTVKTAVLR